MSARRLALNNSAPLRRPAPLRSPRPILRYRRVTKTRQRRPDPPVIDDPPRLRNASLKTGRSNRRGHYKRDQSTFWLIGNRA